MKEEELKEKSELELIEKSNQQLMDVISQLTNDLNTKALSPNVYNDLKVKIETYKDCQKLFEYMISQIKK